jgi:hypothetical protein
MSELCKSVEYYREQHQKFREMMGYKKPWELSDDGFNRKIDLAFKGLFHLYLQAEGITDDDKMHMEALIDEFQRRKFYVEMAE